MKQEPVSIIDREKDEKIIDRLTNEVYSGRGFEIGSYNTTADHLQHGVQLGPSMASLPPVHPPTPDLSPVPPTPAMWNSKINKVGTVSTPDGEYRSSTCFITFQSGTQVSISSTFFWV